MTRNALILRSELEPQDRPEALPASESFVLDHVFAVAEHAPRLLRLTHALLARIAFRCSSSIRAGTRANAAHILGQGATRARRDALARRVVEHFILFCHDVGRSMRMTEDELFAEIERIDGHEHY